MDAAQERTQHWPGQLGTLAAQGSEPGLDLPIPPIGDATSLGRLSAIVHHLRNWRQRQEDAAVKLRVNEVILAS
jgi:hypothetical protein